MKFGGGCLKNPDNFIRVAQVIKARKERCLVVVSAIYGMTDKLMSAIQHAREGESNTRPFIDSFLDDHLRLVREVITSERRRNLLDGEIQRQIQRLRKFLIGISYTRELTDTLEATVVSYGERLSSLILSAVFTEQGIDSKPLSADEIGLITDNAPRNATAILPAVRAEFDRSLMPLIESGLVPVITGYYGCTPEGKITTFGRNGSDYSAAVIAHAVDADVLELWKDVDGFMSADPGMVDVPVKIDSLSYQEAAELAYFGAKLIHPRAMEPVSEKNIPIFIRNLYKPDDRGTVIDSRRHEHSGILKSVTVNRHIAVLRIRGAGVGIKPGIIGRIGGVLKDYRINIYSIITSQTCINLLINKEDARHGFEALNHLSEGVIESLDVHDNLALVAVVGEGILNQKGLAASIFSAVSRVKVNIEMISMGASDVAAYFMVNQEDVNRAVKSIHDSFFSKNISENNSLSAYT
jgi:aspartate kinase